VVLSGGDTRESKVGKRKRKRKQKQQKTKKRGGQDQGTKGKGHGPEPSDNQVTSNDNDSRARAPPAMQAAPFISWGSAAVQTVSERVLAGLRG
jgi:hypothetical protein